MTFDIPDDLVQLRRNFVKADAARASDDRDMAEQAHREAQDLAEAILDHPWWAECGGNKFEARQALIEAARAS
ncbi:hypothetical protein [Actinoallomurus iriomotensis]|uniref:Uncharacterized protein n=1 Tax=Actinoallomurus iriomotensis TaxID=478107 RepID=A0A9W6RXA5_9ACTN|nr:hypothetical protein [Actinoallomurus iriomotensis]GLY81822.1 hypothetical protein Airi01_100890 [Actinoallomurus iriomotensis]